MKYVLTLAGNSAEPLTEAHARAAREALGAGAPADWLAPALACDIGFDAPDPATALRLAREALAGTRLDMAAQPSEGRRKKLLLADMDSTIIQCECLDELADFAGIKPRIAAITERAMRGELDFAAALRERVALLKGLPVSALKRAYERRVRLTQGARELVRTMRANGAYAALVTGGFEFFAAGVAAACGFDEFQANALLDDGKALTGAVREPILGRDAKRDYLRALRSDHRLALGDTLVLGDGANDLDMVREAGLGVAFHAKPVLAEAAAARIDHGDLAVALYFQGYREAEIVRA